jgi:hypothetical protein
VHLTHLQAGGPGILRFSPTRAKLSNRLAAVLPEATCYSSLTSYLDAGLRLLLWLLRIHKSLLDVARQAEECFLYVDVALRRDLHEGNAKLISQCLTLLCRDRSLLLPVALVADEDLVDAFCSVLLYVREPCPDICSLSASVHKPSQSSGK